MLDGPREAAAAPGCPDDNVIYKYDPLRRLRGAGTLQLFCTAVGAQPKGSHRPHSASRA